MMNRPILINVFTSVVVSLITIFVLSTFGVLIVKTPNKVPHNAVVVFSEQECPEGWIQYTPAYGKFIRGIDKSKKIDPDREREPGSVQERQAKKHSHKYKDIYCSEKWGNVKLLQGRKGNKGDQFTLYYWGLGCEKSIKISKS